jgi:hypothetical protein
MAARKKAARKRLTDAQRQQIVDLRSKKIPQTL